MQLREKIGKENGKKEKENKLGKLDRISLLVFLEKGNHQ